MNDENAFGKTEKSRGKYEFYKYPENIRQIGNSGGTKKIYIEDYVMTYIHKCFQEKQENGILILLGQVGKEKVSHCLFAYGAIEIDFAILESRGVIPKEKWDEIYRLIRENFSGARILGWACGLGMWTSKADQIVQQIHEKYFAEEDSILFINDLAEKEEKVFLWKRDVLEEQEGYIVYYEKNPLMQDYMLGTQEEKSIDADYEDKVTANIRQVIQEKEEWKRNKQQIVLGSFLFVVLLSLILGGNMLLKSMDRMQNMEKTITAMQDEMQREVLRLREEESVKSSIEEVIATEVTGKAVGGESGENDSEELSEMIVEKEEKKAVSPTIKNTEAKKEESKDNSQSTESIYQPLGEAGANSGKMLYDNYIVQEGDTLSQIIWSQYHSFYYLESVMEINGIQDSDMIYQGQSLRLPRYQV